MINKKKISNTKWKRPKRRDKSVKKWRRRRTRQTIINKLQENNTDIDIKNKREKKEQEEHDEETTTKKTEDTSAKYDCSVLGLLSLLLLVLFLISLLLWLRGFFLPFRQPFCFSWHLSQYTFFTLRQRLIWGHILVFVCGCRSYYFFQFFLLIFSCFFVFFCYYILFNLLFMLFFFVGRSILLFLLVFLSPVLLLIVHVVLLLRCGSCSVLLFLFVSLFPPVWGPQFFFKTWCGHNCAFTWAPLKNTSCAFGGCLVLQGHFEMDPSLAENSDTIETEFSSDSWCLKIGHIQKLSKIMDKDKLHLTMPWKHQAHLDISCVSSLYPHYDYLNK